MKVTFKTEKQKNPTHNDGFNVLYAPAKRFAFKLRWYLLISLIISPLIFFAWFVVKDTVLVSADGILTTEPIQISASQPSFVESLSVIAGDKVDDQQILIQLTSPQIEQEHKILTAKYEAFKAHNDSGLKTLEALYLKKIAIYRQAKSSQRKINKEFKVYIDRGILPLIDRLLIEEKTIEIESLYQQALIDHKSAVNEHLNGQLANTLLDLELALSEAKIKQTMLKIASPSNGIVNKVYIKKGEFLSAGDPLFSITNLTQPVVHVYLSPNLMNFAKVGQTADIILPNGDVFIGTVDKTTHMSGELPRILSGPFDGNKPAIEVSLSLNEQPEIVIEGLPVRVNFHYLNSKEDKDLLSWFASVKNYFT